MELLPENLPAWELWGFAQTQWRATGFGLVGLDFPAALQLADVLDIPATPTLLRKLRALEREELRAQGEQSKEKDHA